MSTTDVLKYGFFDSLIGLCGIVWSEKGLIRVCLPMESPSELKISILSYFPEAKETAFKSLEKKIASAISSAISGDEVDFSFVPLCTSKWSEFESKVYNLARSIPLGSTLTYGSLAEKIGRPKAYRAVGTALGKNPVPIIVPCHRVLASDGSLSGFSASRGILTKRILLKLEGFSRVSRPLNYDLVEASLFLKNSDPNLAHVIRMVGPPAIDPPRKVLLFESLSKAIVSQQLSVTAAATIQRRLFEKFGSQSGRLNVATILSATDIDLKVCGLSQNKARSIKELADKIANRSLPSVKELALMTNEEVVDALTIVRGIGKWTAEMILIFQLGRADVLAVDDLALRKGHAILKGKKSKETSRKALEIYARRWKPFRSAASWYLWRLNRSPLKKDYLATMRP